MIVATGLTKRYGATLAVDDLSFEIRPGVVTGFLGPNGAGKSSAMRLMLGLDHGDGETRFDGRRFRDIDRPLREVGTMIEGLPFHPTGGRVIICGCWLRPARSRSAGGRGSRTGGVE